jgi:MFS family permease
VDRSPLREHDVAAILGLAALLGIGFAFAQPAEFALVPVVARGRELTQVNGLVETARYTGMALGPLFGGVLAGLGGTNARGLIDNPSALASHKAAG